MTKPIDCVGVNPTLAVPDVEAACQWYVDELGFSLQFFGGGPPHHRAVLPGSGCVHIWQNPPQLGPNWMYLDISDLDRMY